MTLTNIHYFVEAARHENFSEAAKNLFVSQPSLSKQIALMEKEVGTALFFRSNRRVRLTPAGRYLYEQLKDVYRLTEHALERARTIGRDIVGDISVGVLEAQEMNRVIMQRMHAFAGKHPELDIRLERASFSNLRRGLQNGYYDLIITISFEIDTIEGAQQEIILQSRGALAVNLNNPKSSIEDLTLDMLADEDFVAISPEESPNGYALMVKQCQVHGFTPRIVRELTSLESLLLCVEAGMGIAILDRNTRLEKDSAVRMIPIPDSDFSHVSAIWLDANRNPVVRRLAKALSVNTKVD